MTAKSFAHLPTVADDLASGTDFTQDWQAFGQALAADTTHGTVGGMVQHYIDGKAMACPLPLLKLKIALKSTTCGNCVYVSATDPNSEHDIGAFCRIAGHGLVIAHTPAPSTDANGQDTATIIHLLITKNC